MNTLGTWKRNLSVKRLIKAKDGNGFLNISENFEFSTARICATRRAMHEGPYWRLSVLMLCAPVFIFTSGFSALLGRPRCGLLIWLSLLAIFNTLFWVYVNFFQEKTDKTRKYSEVCHFRMILRKWPLTVIRRAEQSERVSLTSPSTQTNACFFFLFLSSQIGREIELDDDLRQLTFYSVESGDTILVRWWMTSALQTQSMSTSGNASTREQVLRQVLEFNEPRYQGIDLYGLFVALLCKKQTVKQCEEFKRWREYELDCGVPLALLSKSYSVSDKHFYAFSEWNIYVWLNLPNQDIA